VAGIFIPKPFRAQKLSPCGLFLKRRILVLVMTRGQKTKLDPAVPSRKLVKRWRVWVPVPQAWLEFDVQSVESATVALESQRYRILVKNKKEPWGQTVTRLLSPEGLLVGITFTPLMRKEK